MPQFAPLFFYFLIYIITLIYCTRLYIVLFVLSGYLITGLLLNEAWATNTIDLARFYTRRFRRLAPALVLVLLVTLLWTYRFAPPAVAPAAAKQVGWSVAYLNNWYALFGKVGYWGAGTTALPLNHLWSLAIEEQFYLVWPLVILLLVRTGLGLRDLRWAVGGLAVLSGALQWLIADHSGVNRAYLGTDTRFAALAIGATVAILLTEVSAERTVPYADNRITARRWSLAVIASTVFLGVSWVTADLSNVSLYHGWLVGCSAAAGVIVSAVVDKSDLVVRPGALAAPAGVDRETQLLALPLALAHLGHVQRRCHARRRSGPVDRADLPHVARVDALLQICGATDTQQFALRAPAPRIDGSRRGGCRGHGHHAAARPARGVGKPARPARGTTARRGNANGGRSPGSSPPRQRVSAFS